jgi:hypothetical protein
MIHRRSDHSVLYVNGYIYAIGHQAFGDFSASCERFNLASNSWERVRKMPTKRSGVGLCSFNDEFIFAFGGRSDEHNSLNLIESYKISKNLWRQVTLAPLSSWKGAALCMGTQIDNERIIIFGDASGESTSTFIFRPEQGTVKEEGSLKESSGFPSPGMRFKN